MTFAYAGGNTKAIASSVTSATTTALTCVAGDLLICVARFATSSRTVTGVTDTAGNTYAQITHVTAGASLGFAVWYAWNAIAQTDNVQTITYDAAVSSTAVMQARFTGVKSASDPYQAFQSVNTISLATLTTGDVAAASPGGLITVAGAYAFGRSFTTNDASSEHLDGSNIGLFSRAIAAGNHTSSINVSSATNFALVAFAVADDSAGGFSLPPFRPRSKHMLIR